MWDRLGRSQHRLLLRRTIIMVEGSPVRATTGHDEVVGERVVLRLNAARNGAVGPVDEVRDPAPAVERTCSGCDVVAS